MEFFVVNFKSKERVIMIYEYRTYEVVPGRMGDLLKRFREHTLRLFDKHDMKVIAFFTPIIGEATNHLTYILAFENLAHRETAWKNFMQDDEWQSVYEKSNSKGQIVVKVENKIFAPTDFSPLQ